MKFAAAPLPFLFFFSLLLASGLLPSPAAAAKFACNATGSHSRCLALLGYTPPNSTTLAAIKLLFQVRSFRALLSANNLPLSTPFYHPVPANSTIRVRIPCACSAGRGVYNGGRPVYTVGPGDGLDAIARGVFNGMVTYQEIAEANNISDTKLIKVGRKLWIPLPCSCDEVDSQPVVHYAYSVAAGSSLEEIAAEFGTKKETLMKLNGFNDPKSLQAEQILDVPLRACSSLISNTSLDYGMHIPNGSYILTANNCVICSCSSSTWQLDCHPTQGISSSTCPRATCGSLNLGNSSSSSVCESTTCAYAGYTNTRSFTILTNLTNQSLCSITGVPLPQPSSASFPWIGQQWRNLLALCTFHIVFLFIGWVRCN